MNFLLFVQRKCKEVKNQIFTQLQFSRFKKMKFFVQKMMRNSVFLSNFLDSLFLSIFFVKQFTHGMFLFLRCTLLWLFLRSAFVFWIFIELKNSLRIQKNRIDIDQMVCAIFTDSQYWWWSTKHLSSHSFDANARKCEKFRSTRWRASLT